MTFNNIHSDNQNQMAFTGTCLLIAAEFPTQTSTFNLFSVIAKYRIAGNFRGRKLSRIGGKYDFRRENFCRLLTCAAPKDAMSPNFTEKTFVNNHKTSKFVSFLPRKFPTIILLITKAFCQNVIKSFWFGSRAPFC